MHLLGVAAASCYMHRTLLVAGCHLQNEEAATTIQSDSADLGAGCCEHSTSLQDGREMCPGSEIFLIVTNIGGHEWVVKAAGSWTARVAKEELERIAGVPCHEQRLLLADGEEWHSGHLLAHHASGTKVRLTMLRMEREFVLLLKGVPLSFRKVDIYKLFKSHGVAHTIKNMPDGVSFTNTRHGMQFGASRQTAVVEMKSHPEALSACSALLNSFQTRPSMHKDMGVCVLMT